MMIYVRLDFGSGDFLPPRGSNFFAEINKKIIIGRILENIVEEIRRRVMTAEAARGAREHTRSAQV